MAVSLFTAFSQTSAITDLAVTDDGHQVYFRLNGTFGVAGVYQMDGFQPSERRLSPYRLDSDYSFLDQRISAPSMSGDGQTVLVNSAWRCRSAFFCGAAPTGNRSYLHQWGDPRELALEGVSSLSRNGRFVFHASPDSQTVSHLYDRTTNTDTRTSIPLRGFRNGVSDNGAVIGRAWLAIGGLALSSPNRETRNLTIEEIVTDASINSIGTHIAYTSSPFRRMALPHRLGQPSPH